MRRARLIPLALGTAVLVWSLLPSREIEVALQARPAGESEDKKVCKECETAKAALEKVRCEKCKAPKEQCDACRKKGMTLHYLMHGNVQPLLKAINAAKDKRDYAAVGKGALALKKLAADHLGKFLPEKTKDEEGNKVYAEGMKQMSPALDGLKAAADKKDYPAVSTAHKLVTGSCMTCHNLFYERRDKRIKEEQEMEPKGAGGK